MRLLLAALGLKEQDLFSHCQNVSFWFSDVASFSFSSLGIMPAKVKGTMRGTAQEEGT
jgi:hypothetical protein